MRKRRFFNTAGEKRKFYNNIRHFGHTREIGFACMGLAALLPMVMIAAAVLVAVMVMSGNLHASEHLQAGARVKSQLHQLVPMLGTVAIYNVKEKQGERLKIVEKMRALTEKAHAESRQLTTEEDKQWNAMDADQEAIGAAVRRFNREEELSRELNASAPPKLSNISDGANQGDREATKEEQEHVSRVFQRYMRFGLDTLDAEEKKLMKTRFRQEPGKDGKIRAAQTVTTTGGGYLIPQGFSQQLEDAIKWYGGMIQACPPFTTETGNPFPWPTDNDTAQIGEQLGINTGAALQDIVFGQVLFGAFKYSSKIVLVPIELLQDSYFDLNAFLARKLGQRIGRIVNQKATTGNGTTEPGGVVTGSTSGKVGTTGQTLTVIYDDLVDLIHAVDPGYRMNPTARFMLHDSSLKVIKKIKDTTGRPLWMPYEGAVLSPGTKDPDTIMGYPYTINQDIAVMAANAKSILFGDFDKYKIRRVMDLMLLRLEERYADVGQVGFLAFARYDGQLLDAGTHPIQYYQNSAT